MSQQTVRQIYVLFQVPLDNAGANETAAAVAVATRPAYAVTDLRRNPVYINLYVNWFRLVASGVVPMARCLFR